MDKFDVTTIDAQKWADEFVRLNSASDKGTMLAWFASAIMAGIDSVKRENQQLTISTKYHDLDKCKHCGATYSFHHWNGEDIPYCTPEFKQQFEPAEVETAAQAGAVLADNLTVEKEKSCENCGASEHKCEYWCVRFSAWQPREKQENKFESKICTINQRIHGLLTDRDNINKRLEILESGKGQKLSELDERLTALENNNIQKLMPLLRAIVSDLRFMLTDLDCSAKSGLANLEKEQEGK
jgi:hypothetical protein